jgi:hypothetical protein
VLDRRREILTTHRAAGRPVYDANIVVPMHDDDLQRLLTFNVADFQRFTPLITDEQVQVMQGGVAQAKDVDGEAPARRRPPETPQPSRRGWQRRPAVRGAPAGKGRDRDRPRLAACHER